MNVHQNARLTPHSRAELVRRVVVEGQTVKAVAAAFGVTVKTVRKWVARFQKWVARFQRRQRPARSLLPAPSPPQADAGSHCRDRRSPAPPALDGPANR